MSGSKNNPGQLQNVKEPQNVKVLIFSESKTSIKEFYFIKSYVNLIKIDLSYNKLTSFPPGFAFSTFRSLRTLFLHYNKFNAIKNLAPIMSCKTLIYLTLFGNPLQQAKARHFIVNQMPSLMLMDNKLVKLQQRDQELNTVYIQADPVPFPLVRHQNQESTEVYLRDMIRQLRIVRQKYVEVNPIIRIQRWWRHLYRLKHRKWKITKLPEEGIKTSTVYDLKHYKHDLDRLITEKMEVSRTNEQKIRSVLEGNFQFWTFMKTFIAEDEVYFTREYCQLNAIQYSQINCLKIFRYKRGSKGVQNSKRNLLFFMEHHRHIVGSWMQRKKPANAVASNQHSKQHPHVKKVEYSLAKYQKTKAKLQKLQEKYRYLVKPSLSPSQILQIVKKEYFKSRDLHIKGVVNQQFPVVFKQLLNKSLAAVTVQRWWRGCKVRKSLNTSRSIREAKAATKIQRWVKNLRFTHRFKFLLEVGIYLRKEKQSAEIILEMSQVAAIQAYCQFKQRGKNFVVLFQECCFSIDKTAHSNHLNVCKNRIVFNSERRPYPSYMKLNFMNQKRQQQGQKCNVLQILFKEAKSVKTVVDCKGVKYLQLTYHSIEEALDRKFILALKTYRMQNHQFVTSNTLPSGTSQVTADWLEIVSNNKLVSIQADSLVLNKKEVQGKSLANQKSYQSLTSDVEMTDGTIYLRVKFYLATLNYSCYLLITSPAFNKLSIQSVSNLSANKEYYFGRKKSYSKRYDDNNGQNFSKISRNILSLDDSLNVHHQKKTSLAYPKILNTDQSHSIIESISYQHSLQKLESQHKFETYDRFNREVYPAASQVVRESLRYKKQLGEIQDLRHKKSIIDEIKESHREKIRDILTKKSENLSTLRGKFSKEEEEHAQEIERARVQLQQRKLKKHQLIREMKMSSGNFELEFMKKGIMSINKKAKDAEKRCTSFREQHRELVNHIAEKKMKKELQKTEIKEFSIKITDGDISLKASDNGKLKSQNGRDHNYHSIMASESHEPSIRLKSDSCDVSSVEEEQRQKKHKHSQALKLQKQLKKARKKRLVHSVFPEQFYPLKQSQQIGFELPKILKK